MRAERGFTLIELLILMGMLGVLFAIAAPFGSDFILRNRLNATSRELLGDLQRLRIKAMTESTRREDVPEDERVNGRGYGIRFLSATTYQTFEFNDRDNNFEYNLDGTEDFGVDQKTLPANIQITLNGGSVGGDVLLFDKNGFSRNRYWSSVAGRTYEIARSGRTRERCVTVALSRIREGSCQ